MEIHLLQIFFLQLCHTLTLQTQVRSKYRSLPIQLIPLVTPLLKLSILISLLLTILFLQHPHSNSTLHPWTLCSQDWLPSMDLTNKWMSTWFSQALTISPPMQKIRAFQDILMPFLNSKLESTLLKPIPMLPGKMLLSLIWLISLFNSILESMD